MNKGDKQLKLCSSDCVEPIWLGCIGRITWQMALTDELCEVHKDVAGHP